MSFLDKVRAGLSPAALADLVRQEEANSLARQCQAEAGRRAATIFDPNQKLREAQRAYQRGAAALRLLSEREPDCCAGELARAAEAMALALEGWHRAPARRKRRRLRKAPRLPRECRRPERWVCERAEQMVLWPEG